MTVKEIATMSGVSTATVSRVLNGKDDVSKDTRELIQKIIQQNSYRPKVVVAAQKDNIGVFISNDKTELSNPYTAIVLSGIADVLFRNEVTITLIPSNKIARNSVDFSIFCAQRRISGCLFLSSTLEDTYIGELSKKIPIVLIGNDLDFDEVGSVRSNNFEGAYKAARYIIELGHRNILLIMASGQFIDHRERMEGARKALLEADIAIHPCNIFNSQALSDNDLNYALAHAFEVSKPDAIIVGGDQDAIRVIRLLYTLGYNIPDDVSIIGYDNLPLSINSNPPLTTVNQPIYEIGAEAAKMLMNIVRNPEQKPCKLVLGDNNLMIRESVRRVKND